MAAARSSVPARGSPRLRALRTWTADRALTLGSRPSESPVRPTVGPPLPRSPRAWASGESRASTTASPHPIAASRRLLYPELPRATEATTSLLPTLRNRSTLGPRCASDRPAVEFETDDKRRVTHPAVAATNAEAPVIGSAKRSSDGAVGAPTSLPVPRLCARSVGAADPLGLVPLLVRDAFTIGTVVGRAVRE